MGEKWAVIARTGVVEVVQWSRLQAQVQSRSFTRVANASRRQEPQGIVGRSRRHRKSKKAAGMSECIVVDAKGTIAKSCGAVDRGRCTATTVAAVMWDA
jgi:hypothetical protein